MEIFVALLASYLLAALPLGSAVIVVLTGHHPKDISVPNVGLENVWRLLGWPAVAALLLDVAKGYAAGWLLPLSLWVLLAAYLGHLYGLPGIGRLTKALVVPRGRGHGLLLGLLLALWRHGWLEALSVATIVTVYLLVLALSRYVTLAGLVALVSWGLLLLGRAWWFGSSLALLPVLGAVAFAALWRHKASLARIADGTEPRLGNPPAVHGRDPQVVYAAFMVHPLSLEDLCQPSSQRWLKPLLEHQRLAKTLLRYINYLMRPQKHGEICGIELADGRELRVALIAAPMLPEHIRQDPEVATKMAIRGARFAKEFGAEAFGLGAFWSTVGNKGLAVQQAVPEIHITNGGAYTAATVKAAVPGLLRHFAAEGGTLKQACAAIVGANGVVAFGVARMIAGEVANVILIGRDAQRLARSRDSLQRKHPQTRVHISTDIAACSSADLIFSATSDPEPVIFAEHVKPGCWILDLGRPADVDVSVQQVPGTHIIPGGVVRPPGKMRSMLDIHFGDGMVPACMAETMIMTATKAFNRKSLGPVTKMADMDFYLREGARLGFEVISRDARVVQLEELV